MSCIDSVTHSVGQQTTHDHWHRTDLLLFIYRGKAELQISDRLYRITKPSVVFIGHLENHAFLHTDDAYARYTAHILPAPANIMLKDSVRLLSLFMNRSENIPHVLEVSGISEQLQTLFGLLLEEYKHGDFSDGQAALLQCILQLIYRYAPESFNSSLQPLTSTARRIQRRFDDNPADEISLAALADEYHLSVSYLTHSFKEATGYSIGKYRFLCRIALAKQLLIDTDLPIGVICSSCGFADLSNFCRYFKQETGSSPTDFRKKHAVSDT
ncbi:MAG: helix-turn-helix domain-containing protein [Oscillospiraceae bacterium]|nr:helix-turn-helix domain-containing protein [Oscillospiraceae bacterium]